MQRSPVREALRSPGRPLDGATRSFMETRFGYDFGRVRVHKDAQAAESALDLDALAYTVGADVVFAAGHYRPHEDEGRHLLAHELAHVVQQDATSGGSGEALVGPAGDAFEREANVAAARVASGRQTPRPSSAPALILQRQPAEKHPSTAVSRPRKGKETRPDLGRGGGLFDATLDRDNGMLTTLTRIAFHFVPSKDLTTGLPKEWTPTEQKNWKRTFISEVTARWSDKYLLVPTTPCADEPMKYVGVTVLVADAGSLKPHWDLTISNEELSQGPGMRREDATGHLNVEDVQATFRPESGTTQVAAEHEFGHALGIHHIACNAAEPDYCHGLTHTEEYGKGEQQSDIMGKGSEVSQRDYLVFAEVMKTFTGCDWQPREKPGVFSQIWNFLTTNPVGLALSLGAIGAGVGALIGAALPVAAAGAGALIGAGVGSVGGLVKGLLD